MKLKIWHVRFLKRPKLQLPEVVRIQDWQEPLPLKTLVLANLLKPRPKVSQLKVRSDRAMRMKLRRKKQGVLRVWENSKKICLRKVFQLVLQTPVCYALCAAPNPKMLVLYMDGFRIKFAVTVARKNCLKVENPAPYVDDAWKKLLKILLHNDILLRILRISNIVRFINEGLNFTFADIFIILIRSIIETITVRQYFFQGLGVWITCPPKSTLSFENDFVQFYKL